MEDVLPEVTQEPAQEPLQEVSTACSHEWVYAEGDKNSELISLACSKCWSGISVAKENLHKYVKSVI